VVCTVAQLHSCTVGACTAVSPSSCCHKNVADDIKNNDTEIDDKMRRYGASETGGGGEDDKSDEMDGWGGDYIRRVLDAAWSSSSTIAL
jgi:hypothetical protein